MDSIARSAPSGDNLASQNFSPSPKHKIAIPASGLFDLVPPTEIEEGNDDFVALILGLSFLLPRAGLSDDSGKFYTVLVGLAGQFSDCERFDQPVDRHRVREITRMTKKSFDRHLAELTRAGLVEVASVHAGVLTLRFARHHVLTKLLAKRATA